jgi:hypothetical protein
MEDKMEITLFKKKALICKNNPKKFDLELFSDVVASKIPTFECLPFLHLPKKSQE